MRLSKLALALFGLAPTSAIAQDVTPPRFALGVTGLAGEIAPNPSFFLGVEGFVRLASGSFWSARVDGGVYPFATKDHYGCILPDPAPACDTRQLGQAGTLMASLVVGPRTAKALRPVYVVLGAGIAVSRWDGGASYPASNVPGRVEAGVGLGPTTPALQAGLGTEFPLAGFNRLELRFHRFTPTGPHHGQGASIAIGWEW